MTKPKNGETKLTTQGYSVDDKLDALIEGLTQLTETVNELKEAQEEIFEKVNNLSLSNTGFDLLDEN